MRWLRGRETCPKQGQTQILCPPPVLQLLQGRGRPIPAPYQAMQTLGYAPRLRAPSSWHTKTPGGELCSQLFPVEKQEENKIPTSERLQWFCLLAALPCCPGTVSVERTQTAAPWGAAPTSPSWSWSRLEGALGCHVRGMQRDGHHSLNLLLLSGLARTGGVTWAGHFLQKCSPPLRAGRAVGQLPWGSATPPARRGGKPSAWILERGSWRAFTLLGAIQACFHGEGRSREGAISTISHGLTPLYAHISCYFTRVTRGSTAESWGS